MSKEVEFDREEIDYLAKCHWQDDLAKFFPKQKEPTYTEYNMFTAGYKEGFKASPKKSIPKEIVDFLEKENNLLKKIVTLAEEIAIHPSVFNEMRKTPSLRKALDAYYSAKGELDDLLQIDE